MRILLAADGSAYTKKALAFLATNDEILGDDRDVVVLNVQTPVPPRVKSLVGSAAVTTYHQEEAQKVLGPAERFLGRHDIATKCRFVVGSCADEIVKAAAKEKAQLIVMGTHGFGLLGRALMGSVAQRVLLDSKIPVLLVK